jgi:hypothetical protein
MKILRTSVFAFPLALVALSICTHIVRAQAPSPSPAPTAAAIPAGTTNPALAPVSNTCRWEWLCDGQANCKQTPICEKLTDNPGAAPGGDAPKPPHALPPFELPRAHATLKCSHVQRQNAKTQRWFWEQVCYCTEGRIDGASATKQSIGRPLEGIARCTA